MRYRVRLARAVSPGVPAVLGVLGMVGILGVVWVACASMAAGAGAAASTSDDDRRVFYQNLSGAMLDLGLSPADCRIRSDYAAPDAFRLPLVDSLMADPTSLLPRVDGIAARVEARHTLTEATASLCEAMSLEKILPAWPNPKLRVALDRPFTNISPRNWRRLSSKPVPILASVRHTRGNLAHLPSQLGQAVGRYLLRLDTLTSLRAAAFAPVEANLDFLRENSAFLVTPRAEYGDISPFELDSLETADTALGDSVLALCRDMEIPLIASMSLTAIDAAEMLGAEVEAWAGATDGTAADTSRAAGDARAAKSGRGSRPSVRHYHGGKVTAGGRMSAVTGDLLYLGLTPWGPVAIGDSGPNAYRGSFALIIDLGGDDTYDLAADPAVNFSLVIDRAGNDIYRSADRAALAGAIFGTSIVMDLAGDDTYQGGDISLAAGIYGTGILYDRSGNDIYDSEAFSQGAGFLGIGLLRDDAGNDSYTAAMQSQAFGYVMGAGVILERGGNDTYFTKMSQTDILRYDDHYLSLSQGCAFGYRPDYSGGIGLLIDEAGNDLYSSDIFGQGVGYWYCVGAIVDRGGHDCYRSYQYAQGAGIHLGFGLLADQWGNDYYVSKGVSQGCGHDLALGLLADFSGDDCYTAVDLSQGAGSANGTGILYDADGSDSYSCKSKVNVNGYGDYRREFGSIGLQIDARGTDYYGVRGANESLWESGRYGLGIDVPGEATKPRGDIVVKEYPFKERAFSTRELYVLAMRSEPRFQTWKKYGFDKMVEDSTASVEFLRTVLDTKDATKRHAIKDVLLKIGPPAVPMLCDETLRGNDLAKAEASWILGLMENPAGFDALIELSRSDDWKQRSNAINSLARLKGLSDDQERKLEARVGEVLADGGEVYYVRKDAAFAAGNRKYSGLIPQLVACFGDSHYSVRYSAAEALRQLARESGTGGETAGDAVGAARSRIPEAIAVELRSSLPGLGALGLAPAIYAAGDLPAREKMDVAEAALGLSGLSEDEKTETAISVGRLLETIEPASRAEAKRLDALKARLPDIWQLTGS